MMGEAPSMACKRGPHRVFSMCLTAGVRERGKGSMSLFDDDCPSPNLSVNSRPREKTSEEIGSRCCQRGVSIISERICILFYMGSVTRVDIIGEASRHEDNNIMYKEPRYLLQKDIIM